MEQMVRHQQKSEENPAVYYAALRNLLLGKGYSIEILASFEPRLYYLAKWWVQLFGESEGKKGTGVFPTMCMYSEDLHSMGQYVQEGKRNLFETFLHLKNQAASVPIPAEPDNCDYFAYLDGKDLADLNEAAYQATVVAHHDGEVPCLIIDIPELNAYYLGQLFYFFEYACYLSGSFLGVDPFDQPGVENYKQKMFQLLGKAE
jgi:glucose-6-phosphate isomerase